MYLSLYYNGLSGVLGSDIYELKSLQQVELGLNDGVGGTASCEGCSTKYCILE
jgi:hypothetical protein